MSSQARLRHPVHGTLGLPWWPTDVEIRTPTGTYEEVERPGEAALLLRKGRTLAEYRLGFIVRDALLGDGATTQAWRSTWDAIAQSQKPVSLLLGDTNRGLYRVTESSVTEIAWDSSGIATVIDVTATLRESVDAPVSIGPVPWRRHRRTNTADPRGGTGVPG